MTGRISKWKLFWGALLVTIVGWLVVYWLHRPDRFVRSQLLPVAGNVFVTSQLSPNSVGYLKSFGIKAVIDIRPDGEEPNQPTSSEMERACSRFGLAFHYFPVPHESIPAAVVDELHEALTADATRTVLYCRTGRRAVRLFALAEASRAGGPGSDAILEMVRSAGFTAEDLRTEIAQRLSRRNESQGVKN